MLLQTKKLSKIYGQNEGKVIALNSAELSVNEGDFISIMGPSGGGKSTLLHLISGLDTPTEGNVFYDGVDIYSLSDKKLSEFRRKKIGFIFQSFNLLPVLTANENILMPLLLDNQKADEKYIKELTTLLAITERLTHLPNELSGGQKQRVAIARALASNPDIIFADEPTGNLDSKSGEEVIKFLCEINKKWGKTIILITHDKSIADMANRKFHIIDGVLSEVNG